MSFKDWFVKREPKGDKIKWLIVLNNDHQYEIKDVEFSERYKTVFNFKFVTGWGLPMACDMKEEESRNGTRCIVRLNLTTETKTTFQPGRKFEVYDEEGQSVQVAVPEKKEEKEDVEASRFEKVIET
jgi:hypothetical protein